jgi:hypothetical protein
MRSPELVLPIIKSNSAERLRNTQWLLGKTAVEPLQLRVGVNARYVTDRPPRWISGLQTLFEEKIYELSALDRDDTERLTGSRGANRGLWVPVDPIELTTEEVTKPERRSQYFENEAYAEAYIEMMDVPRVDVIYPGHYTLWHIKGVAQIQDVAYEAAADFKVGGGGGILSLTEL